ncbi:uncharacterized protein LOC121384395 [Gigantopelta aegis]|uniref:uncharacterized protein LOC121384395 n=1 Tax=Gigantopelta aegis TaxID=1735272 RepID=UPI001B88791B|nr:uncharacterized protein LOC121384395 [Gigantopelta aegis]
MDIDSDDDDWDFKSTKCLKKAKRDAGIRDLKRSTSDTDRNNESAFSSCTKNFSKLISSVNLSRHCKRNHNNKRTKGPHCLEPKRKINAKDMGTLMTGESFFSNATTDIDCIIIGESRTGHSLPSLQHLTTDKTKIIRDKKVGERERKEINRSDLHTNSNERKNFKSKGRRSPRKTNSKNKLLKTPPRNKHEGHCPFCQMPFAALIIQSPNWHTMECMDLPITTTAECPAGLNCDSTLQSHYRRFSHTLLAQTRAGTSPATSETSASSPHSKETFTCESNTAYLPGHVTSSSSSQSTLYIDKKSTELALNTSCTPGSKLKSCNNPKRRNLHKNQQHSESKRNIAKFFTGSQESKVDQYFKFDSDITITNGTSSPERCKQRDLADEVNQEYTKTDCTTENRCRPVQNIISDGVSEIKEERCNRMLMDSDKTMVYANKITVDSDEELGDPMHLLMESDTDVDSVDSDGASVDLVKSSTVQGHDRDGRCSIGMIKYSTSSSLCHNSAAISVIKSSTANSLDIPFSRDGEDLTELKDTVSLEGTDSQVTETLSSLEADDTVGDFDEDIECSDVDTPEMLEDGSVKVRNFFSRKSFPTSPDITPNILPKDESLPAVGDILRSNNSKPMGNDDTCRVTDQTVAMSGAVIDATMATSLLNSTKQTSLFGFFQKVRCKKATGTSSGDRTTNSGTSTGKSHVSLSSNVNRSNNFEIKDSSSVCRQSRSQWTSGGNHEQTISRKDATFEQKTKYTGLATDVSATVSSIQNPQEGFRGRKYNCPFYKKIPDTCITVDAFRYGNIPGCKAYVLTHFHYDHYGGLTKRFCQPLYCTKVTGNLVKAKIKVSEQYIHILPMNQPCIVEDVQLTLMEANHCPGAAIILFRLRDGRSFLHTGDFRACSEMEEYSPLNGVTIDQLYLDTTYCDPAHVFPNQKDVIQFAVSLVQKTIEQNSRTLIICGTYTIGKEKIFLAIAEAINSKIGVARDKKVILDCLEDVRLTERTTLQLDECQIHVLPMGKLKPQTLADHLSLYKNFSQILALEPTGWTYSNKLASLDQIRPKYSKTGISIYGIPYSEHSSYLEMKRFTQFIRPGKILPTVNNGNPQSRKKMEAHFKSWMDELDNPVPTNTVKQSAIDKWL